MKQQISRFSPHQNGKVFGVLMACTSLVLIVPIMILTSIAAPEGAAPPIFIFIAMPIIYLVMGYVSVAIGCAIYNFAFGFLGGIEFETNTERH